MSSSPPSGLLQRPTTTAATVDDQDERQHDHDLTMEHDSNQDEDMFSTTTNNNNDTNALEASFFPSPSHYYKRYTSYNLSLPLDYPEILHLPNDDNSGGGFTRQDLVPPHLDWVLERGTYTVFGEVWPLDDQLPSLRDMGVEELFDPLQPDRSHSLQTLLQALLVTYHQLVTSLLAPPRSIHDDQQGLPSDPERYVDRIRLIGINLHHSINELRPVQAKESLKAMMRTQIERRKAKTSAIQQKCQEITQALSTLSTTLEQAVVIGGDVMKPKEEGTNNLIRRNEPQSEGDGEGVDPMGTALRRLKERVDDL